MFVELRNAQGSKESYQRIATSYDFVFSLDVLKCAAWVRCSTISYSTNDTTDCYIAGTLMTLSMSARSHPSVDAEEVHCPVCALSLGGLPDSAQHQHVNQCLDLGPRMPSDKENRKHAHGNNRSEASWTQTRLIYDNQEVKVCADRSMTGALTS